MTPAALLESLEALHSMPIMQRPTANSLARVTGLGRRAMGSVVDAVVCAESLLGFSRNRSPLCPAGRVLEVDATAVRKVAQLREILGFPR